MGNVSTVRAASSRHSACHKALHRAVPVVTHRVTRPYALARGSQGDHCAALYEFFGEGS